MRRDVITDLVPGPRRLCRELQDAGVHVPQIVQRRTARRTPRTEAPFHRGERVRRVFACRYQMERRAHQGRLHDLAALDRPGELIALERDEPAPERDVR